MADVYSRSYLNLAASAARDGRDGLFFTHKEPIRVRCKLPTSEDDSIFISEVRYDTVDWTYWKEVTEGPLYLRAWTTQERILPPRTVFFGKTQLHWECHEDLKSESQFSSLVHDESFSLNLRQYLASVTEEETLYLCVLWYCMVEAYSKCSLTKREDKLPALSGLAKAFSRRTNFAYTAGLWEEDLATGLLWRTRSPKTKPRPPPYRAPSWSWASLDTPIKFSCGTYYIAGKARRHLQPLVQSVRPQISHGSYDLFGAVSQESRHSLHDA